MSRVNSLNCTRYSAIAQFLLGVLISVLIIVFGAIGVAGILHIDVIIHVIIVACTGVWLVITGIIGFRGSFQTSANNGRVSSALIGIYICFSTICTVVVGCCAIILWPLLWILFCIEAPVVIWASICGCFTISGGCRCCYRPTTTIVMQQPAQMGHNQILYIQTESGPQAYIVTQGANGVPVAVPALAPGQDQMYVNVPQDTNPPPPYSATIDDQGGSTHDAQPPPSYETIRVDIPPVNQGYTATTEGGVQGGSTHDAQAPPSYEIIRVDMPPVNQGYTATTEGGDQGGSTHDAQPPPSYETIRVDMPPVNQGYTATTEGGVQGGSTHDAQAPPSYETIRVDMPPDNQGYTAATDGGDQDQETINSDLPSVYQELIFNTETTELRVDMPPVNQEYTVYV